MYIVVQKFDIFATACFSQKRAGYKTVFVTLPCLCGFHKTPCNWSPNKGWNC